MRAANRDRMRGISPDQADGSGLIGELTRVHGVRMRDRGYSDLEGTLGVLVRAYDRDRREGRLRFSEEFGLWLDRRLEVFG